MYCKRKIIMINLKCNKKIGKRVKEKMKNSKGFTLIELLAVITIMGILMLVAIPAVSRTIENSRRDTFMNTAKSYVNAVKNAAAADEIKCGTEMLSAKGTGYYSITFNSLNDSGKDLMEQGGKSSWGNSEVKGVIIIQKKVENNRNTYKYSVAMIDAQGRGIGTFKNNKVATKMISEEALSRADVKTADGDNRKTAYGTAADELPAPTKADTKIDAAAITTDVVGGCQIVM